MENILQIADLTKRYPDFYLDHLTLNVPSGKRENKPHFGRMYIFEAHKCEDWYGHRSECLRP